jgi:hypothetical protein
MQNIYTIINKRITLSTTCHVSVSDILNSRFFWITLSEPCSSLEAAVDAVLKIGVR